MKRQESILLALKRKLNNAMKTQRVIIGIKLGHSLQPSNQKNGHQLIEITVEEVEPLQTLNRIAEAKRLTNTKALSQKKGELAEVFNR